MLNSSRKRKIIALLIIPVLGFSIWQMLGGNKKPVRYQTAKVERGTLISSLSASGQVSSINSENITTLATGTIKNVFVKIGDFVAKGQTIAEIDLDQAGLERQAKAWADYLSAKNTLDSANAALHTLQSKMFVANQKFINDRGVANPSADQKADPVYIEENADWLAAEANYINQKDVIDKANIALNSAWLSYLQVSATIVAPISGTISELLVAKEAALSGSNSTTLTSLKIAGIKIDGTPAIILSLSEIDAPKIKIGNKATLTFDAISGKTFTGRIVGIDTLGLVTSGVTNYPVLIAMDTQAPGIFPNMSALAEIIIAEKLNVLIVPSSAVQNQGDQSFVRVLKNGAPQRVLIKTGISSDTQIEITSGLSEGSEVITGVVSATNSQRQQSVSPFGVRFGGIGGGTRNTR